MGQVGHTALGFASSSCRAQEEWGRAGEAGRQQRAGQRLHGTKSPTALRLPLKNCARWVPPQATSRRRRRLTRTHCVCIVCPQRSTVVGSTLSNRNSKQMGQFWCIARSTHWWLPCREQEGAAALFSSSISPSAHQPRGNRHAPQAALEHEREQGRQHPAGSGAALACSAIE